MLAIAMAGCANVGVSRPDVPRAQRADAEARDCAAHFVRLDAAIDAAGVRDGSEARMENFPYLRVNRFLASFAAQISANAAADEFATWIAALHELDRAARAAEISNLPDQTIAELANIPQPTKHEIQVRTNECAALLLNALKADLGNATQRQAIVESARVPDDYSTLKRTFGLYPLLKYPFFKGVEAWQRDTARTLQSNTVDAVTTSRSTRYTPARHTPIGQMPPETVIAKYKSADRNSLGIAALSASDWQQLLDIYAPIFEIETATDDDRIGALQWHDGDGRQIEPKTKVDKNRPAVYRRLAHTRIQGRTYSQLVYSVWFGARPRAQPLDLLSGELDNLIWRVTLSDDGTPLIYDSIHGCGCYHLFFPTPQVQPNQAPAAHMEWAFIPALVPSLSAAQQVTLRIAAASHYIVGVDVMARMDTGMASTIYEWRDDEQLRALPLNNKNTRSIFLPNGLIAGTERGERFFFWPMGIASPGAMRQWGRHATAFVGVRHFDDADLFDRRFTVVNKR